MALGEHTCAVGVTNGRTSLLKTELTTLAEPFCDSSFELPPAGMSGAGGWHTAWSGVNKYLVKRGLVETQGSPKFYGLTEQGWAVVASLRGQQPPQQQPPQPPPQQPPMQPEEPDGPSARPPAPATRVPALPNQPCAHSSDPTDILVEAAVRAAKGASDLQQRWHPEYATSLQTQAQHRAAAEQWQVTLLLDNRCDSL